MFETSTVEFLDEDSIEISPSFGLRIQSLHTPARPGFIGGAWYNENGKLIGWGYLNQGTLERISRQIPEGKAFYIIVDPELRQLTQMGFRGNSHFVDQVLRAKARDGASASEIGMIALNSLHIRYGTPDAYANSANDIRSLARYVITRGCVGAINHKRRYNRNKQVRQNGCIFTVVPENAPKDQ